MDTNGDDILQKAEVDAMLEHVPHEKCMFGFLISSDLDGDHALNREEWEEAFKYVGEYVNMLCNRLLILAVTCVVCACMVSP